MDMDHLLYAGKTMSEIRRMPSKELLQWAHSVRPRFKKSRVYLKAYDPDTEEPIFGRRLKSRDMVMFELFREELKESTVRDTILTNIALEAVGRPRSTYKYPNLYLPPSGNILNDQEMVNMRNTFKLLSQVRDEAPFPEYTTNLINHLNALSTFLEPFKRRGISMKDTPLYQDVALALRKVQMAAIKKQIVVGIRARYKSNDQYVTYILNNPGVKRILKDLFEFSKDLYPDKGSIRASENFSVVAPNYSYWDPEFLEFKEFASYSDQNPQSGALFPFINLTDIDLTRYQIFDNEKDFVEGNQEHCIIYALRQSGQVSEHQITQLKLTITSQQLLKRRIGQIARLIKKNIKVAYYRRSTMSKSTTQIKWSDFKCEGATDTIKLGLIYDHYFVYDAMTPYTKFFLRHIEELEPYDIPNKYQIIEIRKNKSYRYARKPPKTSSLALIRHLYDKRDFTFRMAPIKLINQRIDLDRDDAFYQMRLEDKEVQVSNRKVYQPKSYVVFFADTETSVDKNPHDFQIGSVSSPIIISTLSRVHDDSEILRGLEGGETPSIYTFYDPLFMLRKIVSMFWEIAHNMEKELKPTLLVYFHNLKYDMSFFWKYMDHIRTVEKGQTLYEVQGIMNRTRIIFRDSLKIIPKKLADFPSMFGLENIQKEAMPYKWYTKERWEKAKLDYKFPLSSVKPKHFNDANDYDRFIENLNKLDFIYETNGVKRFDAIGYAVFYCEQDVRVLSQGMMKFYEMIRQSTGLNAFDSLTISSLATKYVNEQGVYDDVQPLDGFNRVFVQRAVVGGRVATMYNEKHHLKEKIQDFDAVSLYPSAMARCGFPKGPEKVIRGLKEFKNVWESGKFFVIEIKIKSIKRALPIPFLRLITKKGESISLPTKSEEIPFVLAYFNGLEPHTMVADKYAIEDLIKYHGCTFEFIRGLWWPDGYNDKIKEVIRYLFEQRLKYKKERNPIQEVYKLIMNSIYGKTIMKASKTEIRYVNQRDLNQYILQHYGIIHSIIQINPNVVKVKQYKQILNHKNYGHCGVSVLSMSKRIMNEVMFTAFSNDIPIYYQDTDSMHIRDSDVKRLADLFKEKYGRDLIGKNLGQFHVDFDLPGSVIEPYSTECIILGKKVYADHIEGRSADGKPLRKFHLRMKGIPLMSIEDLCQKRNQTPIQLYADMLNGEEITFDLLIGKVRFKYLSNGNVTSVKQFQRTLKF